MMAEANISLEQKRILKALLLDDDLETSVQAFGVVNHSDVDVALDPGPSNSTLVRTSACCALLR